MIRMTRTRLGIAAVLFAAAGIASAQNTAGPQGSVQGPGGRGRSGGPPGGGGPMGRGGPMAGLPLERLGLSDSQRDQVRSIVQSYDEELKAVGERARQARGALNAAIVADTFDENLIRARASELAQVEADMAVAQARVRAEVFQQVLTPAQKTQAKAWQAERQPRMERRPEGRGGRPPRSAI